MQYLKCVAALFLITGLIGSVIYSISEKCRSNDPVFETIKDVVVWLLGGLCLYLLLLIFGIEI